jgi:hypothetical protein
VGRFQGLLRAPASSVLVLAHWAGPRGVLPWGDGSGLSSGTRLDPAHRGCPLLGCAVAVRALDRGGIVRRPGAGSG